MSEGLDALNTYVRSLYGLLLGEHLENWKVPSPQRNAPVAANYPQLPYPMQDLGDGVVSALASDQVPYPQQNSRIVVGIDTPTTIYLHEQPNDGARMEIVAGPKMTAALTVDGNGLTVIDAASKVYTSGDLPLRLFYRADLATWIDITSPLVAASESPLPSDMDDLLITGLCIRLSPRFGHDPRAATTGTNAYMLKLAKTRYQQNMPTVWKSNEAPNTPQSSAHYGRMW